MKYLNQLSSEELKQLMESMGLKILDEDFEDNFKWVVASKKDSMLVRCQDLKFDIEEYRKRNPLAYAYASVFPDNVAYSNLISDKNIYMVDDYMLFRVRFDMDTEIYPRDKEINHAYAEFMQKRFAESDYASDRQEFVEQITNEERDL